MVATRIKRLRRSMSFTGAFVALAVGVLLPVLLSTSVGIVTLALAESVEGIAIGVLIVCFAVAAIAGAVSVVVFLGKRARIARQQADLLANVTHDLRTPLAAIRMWTQTMQLGRIAGDEARTSQALETILRETEWLDASIDRLLTWRAAAKDRDELDLRAAPLTPVVEDAVAHFRRMLGPGDAELVVAIDSRNVVEHDFQGIGSIVLNLLINAFKYTGATKRIEITLRDSGPWVELAVHDNGIGIEPREAGRIFDPFYRVDSRLGGQSSGPGLGLAIVRHQALAHRGEVTVESEPGRGSRFLVRLPARPQAARPPDEEDRCP
jgi:two-component system phosphate regulon sensor histidine kinase PhoR